jgi:hypothetical protein
MPLSYGMRLFHSGGVAEVSASSSVPKVVARLTAGHEPISMSVSRARRLEGVSRPKGFSTCGGRRVASQGGQPRSGLRGLGAA